MLHYPLKIQKNPILFLSLFIFLGHGQVSAQTPFEEILGAVTVKYADVLVEEAASPDTLVLEGGEKIALIGLKFPETTRKKRVERDERGLVVKSQQGPETSVEDRAVNFVETLVKKKRVRLEFDEEKRNNQHRVQAYVFLEDGTFVNEEILRQGYASLQIRPPNTKYADQLRAAYKEARKEKRGLQSE